MSSQKNRRGRVIFSLSFAICLIVPAFQETILLRIGEANPLVSQADIKIVCRDTGFSPQSGTDALDALIRQNAERFEIKHDATFFAPLSWSDCCFFLADSDRAAEADPRLASQAFEYNGRSVNLFLSDVDFGFLDDTTFDCLAQANGIETGTDGAILYNLDLHGQKLLKSVDPSEDVTLHFLPRSFLYDAQIDADGGTEEIYSPVWRETHRDFLRAADPVSVTKAIRILGLTEKPPDDLDLDFSMPTLLFPERMNASFRTLLADVRTEPAEYPEGTDRAVKQYYCKLTYPKTDADTFVEAINTDPRFLVSIEQFGTGTMSFETTGFSSDDSFEENVPLAEIDFFDLNIRRDQLELFQSTIPQMQAIMLTTVAWTLFVGVLNTAHMNRMTRRREKAILESIGMGTRQKTGMLLYESAQYALHSALLGFFGFFVIYFPVWRDFQDLLRSNDLVVQGNRITNTDAVWNGTAADWGNYLRAFGEACTQVWWVFAAGAALIFVLLVTIDRSIERRSRREDLIQILKDDSVSADSV